jgi:hypothetical protein
MSTKQYTQNEAPTQGVKLKQARWLTDEMGFCVIPIKRGEKKPPFAWEEYQTRRPTDAELEQWFGDDYFDVGVVCGAISNLCVVDIEGDALARQPSVLDEIVTLTATTPSSGRHYYLRPNGEAVRKIGMDDTQGHIGEVRGDGHYVVAPPSGGRDWLDPIAPIAPLPPTEHFRKWSGAADPDKQEQMGAGEKPNARDYGDTPERWFVQAAYFGARHEGDRHDELLRLAKAARNAGVSEVTATRALEALCRANKLIEDGEAEVVRTIRDGWNYGADPKDAAGAMRLLSWDEATADVPERWVVPNLIPWGISVIGGKWKSLKSFLAVHEMLEAAAAGLRVVYIVAEGGGGFNKRLRAWMARHKKEGAQPNFKVVKRPVNFTASDAIKQLSEVVREFKPDVVVVDTLARCFGGGEENSARDMNRFVEGCDTLRLTFGCSVVVVHHVGKDATKGYRGSTALPGAVDMASMVRKSRCKEFASWRCTDMRDHEEFSERFFKMEKAEGSLVAVPIAAADLPASVRFGDVAATARGPGRATAGKTPEAGQSFEVWGKAFGTGKPARQARYKARLSLEAAGWAVAGEGDAARWVAPEDGGGDEDEEQMA